MKFALNNMYSDLPVLEWEGLQYVCTLSKIAEALKHRIWGLEGNLEDMCSSPPQRIFLHQTRLHSYLSDREEKYTIIHSTNSQRDRLTAGPS